MEIYRCDRCRKELTKVKGRFFFTQGWKPGKTIDLCGECLKSFKRWLKGKEEEGEEQQ